MRPPPLRQPPLIWNMLRRLRSRNNGRPTTQQQALRIRLHRRTADAFFDWLDTQDLTLDTFGQPELEHWLGDPAGRYRYEAATFIRWAHANKLTTTYLHTRRWRGPVNPLDDDHRWATARRLLYDTTIDAEDRLAGLLLLLYAQGPSTIALLTTNQMTIADDGVSISFGRTPIRLPHPVDELARTVVTTGKGHATIGATTPSRWLFPGGQPGRPISAQRLKQRLNRLGIRPNQGPQHRTVPTRHRDPRRHPRPNTRHQRQRRRPLATNLRRRLGWLRRRHQPPIHRPNPKAFRQFEYLTRPRTRCGPCCKPRTVRQHE
ncbi:hypothetical protein ACIBG0_39575 [Nocardia sp. NPDC050630]|uniref:hypothetical protein n=1 Tax=Nocardia sp. NPDC050630 TaxID=3364321 RepID=UPI0037AE1B77